MSTVTGRPGSNALTTLRALQKRFDAGEDVRAGLVETLPEILPRGEYGHLKPNVAFTHSAPDGFHLDVRDPSSLRQNFLWSLFTRQAEFNLLSQQRGPFAPTTSVDRFEVGDDTVTVRIARDRDARAFDNGAKFQELRIQVGPDGKASSFTVENDSGRFSKHQTLPADPNPPAP